MSKKVTVIVHKMSKILRRGLSMWTKMRLVTSIGPVHKAIHISSTPIYKWWLHALREICQKLLSLPTTALKGTWLPKCLSDSPCKIFLEIQPVCYLTGNTDRWRDGGEPKEEESHKTDQLWTQWVKPHLSKYNLTCDIFSTVRCSFPHPTWRYPIQPLIAPRCYIHVYIMVFWKNR